MAGPAAAVIFDLDGTLIDSLADIAESTNAVLAEGGYPTHSLESYKRFVGDGMPSLVRRALPAASRDPATIDALVEAVRSVYRTRWDRKTRPYGGIAELLDALVERGISLSVLSNKPQESAELVVARLLARWRFAVVVGARPDLPLKPDPAGAILIARALGLEPSRIAYLGDTDTDMRTARAAGMYAVGAGWGFRPASELQTTGARLVIERPIDLLAILEDLSEPAAGASS
jgi:phosphoglycolate phosphatase